MFEPEFGKLNLKLNQKKCYHENHEKRAFKKAQTKKAEGIKFKNQYKYLQNSGRLTALIDSLK
jgi:hypothetical protein